MTADVVMSLLRVTCTFWSLKITQTALHGCCVKTLNDLSKRQKIRLAPAFTELYRRNLSSASVPCALQHSDHFIKSSFCCPTTVLLFLHFKGCVQIVVNFISVSTELLIQHHRPLKVALGFLCAARNNQLMFCSFRLGCFLCYVLLCAVSVNRACGWFNVVNSLMTMKFANIQNKYDSNF